MGDMDNGLRFGQVEVVCEGYDYPDDPYILAGSCGLEYTLELTKEGREKRSNSGGQNQQQQQQARPEQEPSAPPAPEPERQEGQAYAGAYSAAWGQPQHQASP